MTDGRTDGRYKRVKHAAALKIQTVISTRHYDYNGLLEISEILIVSDVFFSLRSVYNAPLPPQTPIWLGRGTTDTLPHPSLPLRRRAFQWGPGVVECVGPTRWLIRPCRSGEPIRISG